MSANLIERVEPCFLIGCSRCANEDTAFTDTIDAAVDTFIQLGWTCEGIRAFCPACNGEMK